MSEVTGPAALVRMGVRVALAVGLIGLMCLSALA